MQVPDQSDSTPASGLVFVLSGPSGVGKSTIVEHLKRDGFPITYCVTATTRPRRTGEVDGVHYLFVSEEKYDEWLAQGQFLENATVHNLHRYGIPLQSVRNGLRLGNALIMAPDVQGADTVRRKLPNAITIFLTPPRLEDLVPRLAARGTETPEEREVRLQTARRELERTSEFDYVVINRPDCLQDAIEDIKAIIRAERLRTSPRTVVV